MSIYAGAVVFEQLFGIGVVTSIFIVSVVVSLYTVLGGLKAVVVTETVNTVCLLIGACIITVYAVFALPAHGIHTIAQFKAAVRPNQLSMLQTHSSAGLNWYAIFLGYPVMGVWYWCTDQTIVQRLLGARTEYDAQVGPLLAGFLKIAPVFLLVLPDPHQSVNPDGAQRADLGGSPRRSHERGLGRIEQFRNIDRGRSRKEVSS